MGHNTTRQASRNKAEISWKCNLQPTADIYKCTDNQFSKWLSTYLLASRNSPLMVADSELSEGYLVRRNTMLDILGIQPTTWLSSRGSMDSITQTTLVGLAVGISHS
mgnify:CR=1 FL=1